MNKILSRKMISTTINTIFGNTVYERRKATFTDMVLSIIHSNRLSISFIGRTMASLLLCSPKHCIKRVDRFLGNHLIKVDKHIDSFCHWLTGTRKEIVVSLDWTEYGIDRHHRLAINLVTSHGRATPLLWKTYEYGAIRNRRSFYERAILRRLKSIIGDCHVIVLADRGFVDRRLFHLISKRLKWDYVIRLRANMLMKTSKGCARALSHYKLNPDMVHQYLGVLLTARKTKVDSVVIARDSNAKESWYLASSLIGNKNRIVSLYRRRFTCEEQFRDEKDIRFGLGTKQTRFSCCDRRDRMLLVNAIATVLLTLLGATGERLGYDKKLRANTSLKRTHSLFRQGREYAKSVMLTYLKPFEHSFKVLLAEFRCISTTYGVC